MSEPIKVGDLVMFVHSCCDRFRDGVTIFTVGIIKPDRSGSVCSSCRRELPHEQYAAEQPSYGGAPLSWLKRIPPLGELEGVEHEEEIAA